MEPACRNLGCVTDQLTAPLEKMKSDVVSYTFFSFYVSYLPVDVSFIAS